MASSSNCHEDLPFEDEEIIEAISCCFEEKANFLDHETGINLLGILVADEELGMGGIQAKLMSMWKAIGQVRIIRIKKNAYSLYVGSEKLARRLIDDSPWNVKGFCFSVRLWPNHHSFEEIETCRATYWIQPHGIPPELMTKNNGRKLEEMLGSVLEVEDPNEVEQEARSSRVDNRAGGLEEQPSRQRRGAAQQGEAAEKGDWRSSRADRRAK
ncbi:hypothetical protein ACLB2K_066860 [Fragaria x ananassa]